MKINERPSTTPWKPSTQPKPVASNSKSVEESSACPATTLPEEMWEKICSYDPKIIFSLFQTSQKFRQQFATEYRGSLKKIGIQTDCQVFIYAKYFGKALTSLNLSGVKFQVKFPCFRVKCMLEPENYIIHPHTPSPTQTPITNVSFKDILQQVPHLLELNLSKCSIEDNDSYDALKTLPALKKLNLSSVFINAENLITLANSLKCLNNLTHLNLKNTKIGSNALAIAESLKNHTHLEFLNLSENNISPEDVQTIKTTLSNLTDLQLVFEETLQTKDKDKTNDFNDINDFNDLRDDR